MRNFHKVLLKTLTIGLLIAGPHLFAQNPPAGDTQGRNLKSLLNPDGSINLHRGFNGSANATGYAMVSGPAGEQRFIESVPGDEKWDGQFGLSGVRGTVYAVTVSGTDVYVGGRFLEAGTDTVGSVAKWNSVTNRWSGLGTGVGGGEYVFDIAVIGTDVFVAGDFQSAGGVSAANIARWNGSSWSALGAGLGSQAISVAKLAVNGGDLYAVGDFVRSGNDTTVKHVARWNGSAWTGLGVNLGGLYDIVGVRSIAFVGSDIYIGGYFSSVNGVPAANIAKYSGGVWSALGSGLYGRGEAGGTRIDNIMVVGTDMYVTGTFDSAGTVRAVNIAKWDGNAWSSMGTGQQGNFLTRGSGIAVGNGEVYVAGKWPDSTLVYIAKWNGSTWTAVGRDVGNPVNATVNSIAFSGTDIYVGGAGFPYATGSEIGVERFNTLTARWHALGNTPSMEVYALAVRGADVFLGGWFRGSGTVSAYKIAKWNGTTWSALGAGVGGTNGGGYVRAIAVSGNRVYVGGAFNSAGTVSANNIAVWDDSTQTWSALGTGVAIPSAPFGIYPTVFAITVHGTDVYVGGTFTEAGGVPVNRIAKWDGSAWSAIGTGITSTGYPDVRAIAVNGPDDIYAGGTFLERLQHWNGTTWSGFAPITGSLVSSLMLSGTDLYIGGQFRVVGGVSASNIAQWNGSTWSALGAGVNLSVNAMATSGNDVYAGGEFTTAGGLVNGRGIARWDGTSWNALGSGITGGAWGGNAGVVDALATSGNSVFVGGSFTGIGGKWSNYFARWDGTPTSVREDALQPVRLSLEQNYPNPFNPTTIIAYQLSAVSDVRLAVYDLLGREVAVLVNEKKPAGSYEVKFVGAGLASGAYFYRLEAGNQVQTRKLLLLR